MSDLLNNREALGDIHAHARQWADLLKLPFRQHRWRGHAGEFMGMGVGSSLDFQDHRAYMPGDDPRQINWQAYARTGHYTMKLYREEVRPLVDLLFDVSPSMFAFPAKEQRALELFYYGFESASRVGSSVKTYAVHGDAHRLLPEDAILSHRWPEELNGLNANTSAPPLLARLPLRAGSLRLLLSDLLFPGAPENILPALSARNGRGLVFAPFAREEADPGWEGNFEFVDAETRGHHLHRVEPALLQRYEQAYRRHFELWKIGARKYGVALARVSAESAFEAALRTEAIAVGAVEV
ncbi:MAG: DUF58 domain-containing protein [Verrucomicrobiales bacterium]